MNRKIECSNSKTLKLSNALITEINISDQSSFMNSVIKMENYIKSKGATPIGPIIQKTMYKIDDNGELEINVSLIRQANTFIENVEAPFCMESVIRVSDCMYAHFVGPEKKLDVAFSKIKVNAFEEDIMLSSNNYIVFVDKKDDTVVADIFVEKKNNE